MSAPDRRVVDRVVDVLAACSRAVDRLVGVLVEHAQRQDARALRRARARRRGSGAH